MSPMHQAPSVQTSPRSHPKSHLPTAGRSQGGLKRTFTSNAARGRCRDVQRAPWESWVGKLLWPTLGMGRARKLLSPLLASVQGVSPKGRSVTVSSAGHRDTCPKQGAGTLGSWSPPRLQHHLHPLLLSPFLGMGMSLTECLPLQFCVLRVMCSPEWQVETASPCHSSLHLCVTEMKTPACFIPSKNQLEAAWCYPA